MFLPISSLSASPALAGATVFAPAALALVGWAIVAALVGLAVGFLVRQALAEEARLRPRLRLVPTANAWGYSDRALLDESAVGL